MSKKSIYELVLNETTIVQDITRGAASITQTVTRVPGGWVYMTEVSDTAFRTLTSSYVPYSDEFNPNKKAPRAAHDIR